jgi:hypothetical protein
MCWPTSLTPAALCRPPELAESPPPPFAAGFPCARSWRSAPHGAGRTGLCCVCVCVFAAASDCRYPSCGTPPSPPPLRRLELWVGGVKSSFTASSSFLMPPAPTLAPAGSLVPSMELKFETHEPQNRILSTTNRNLGVAHGVDVGQ